MIDYGINKFKQRIEDNKYITPDIIRKVKNYDYLIDNLNKLEEKKDRLLNKNKTLEIKF